MLHEEAIAVTGKPAKPKIKDNVVALIEWRDGTVIDCVRELDLS